jgi:hypothetical protein
VLYALDTTTATYGFNTGRYDRSRTLIIDPLLQSTYLGGDGGTDFPTAMANPPGHRRCVRGRLHRLHQLP